MAMNPVSLAPGIPLGAVPVNAEGKRRTDGEGAQGDLASVFAALLAAMFGPTQVARQAPVPPQESPAPIQGVDGVAAPSSQLAGAVLTNGLPAATTVPLALQRNGNQAEGTPFAGGPTALDARQANATAEQTTVPVPVGAVAQAQRVQLEVPPNTPEMVDPAAQLFREIVQALLAEQQSAPAQQTAGNDEPQPTEPQPTEPQLQPKPFVDAQAVAAVGSVATPTESPATDNVNVTTPPGHRPPAVGPDAEPVQRSVDANRLKSPSTALDQPPFPQGLSIQLATADRAAPAAVATAAAATPLTPEQVVETVSRGAAKLKPGHYTLSLRLFPESLGEVKLQVLITGKEVRTIMQVSNPEAKQALEAHSEQLRQGLGEAGLALSGFSVSTGQGDGARQQFAAVIEELQQRRRAASPQTAQGPQPTAANRIRTRSPGGMLDTMA